MSARVAPGQPHATPGRTALALPTLGPPRSQHPPYRHVPQLPAGLSDGQLGAAVAVPIAVVVPVVVLLLAGWVVVVRRAQNRGLTGRVLAPQVGVWGGVGWGVWGGRGSPRHTGHGLNGSRGTWEPPLGRRQLTP
jgi:hypothetical protein